MKKKVILTMVVSLFLAVAAASAQTAKTNFAGDWTLDVSKSKLPENARIESMTMKVTQTDKELKIERSTKRAPGNERGSGGGMGGMMRGDGAAQTETYSLDGKETSADFSGERGTGKEIRKATFTPDGKLSLTVTRNINGERGNFTIKTNETWELADAAGNALKVTRYMETPRGATNAELYFTKKALDAAQTVGGLPASGSQTLVLPKRNPPTNSYLNGKATKLVKPAYPAEAKGSKASGVINVQVTIDEQGNVIEARAVNGDALLRPAAEEAARNSKFAPTLLQGVPVKIYGIILYNFVP